MASIATMLKGNIHKELKERAQRALDESVEAAKVEQQRLDTLRARLEFHSFDSEAGSYRGRTLVGGCHGRLPSCWHAGKVQMVMIDVIFSQVKNKL